MWPFREDEGYEYDGEVIEHESDGKVFQAIEDILTLIFGTAEEDNVEQETRRTAQEQKRS